MVHGDQKLLTSIQPLWEKLNSERRKNSPHFKGHYKTMTFAKRKKAIIQKSKDGNMLVSLVYNQKGLPVAYCVTILKEEKVGELESIFVEKISRKKGFAKLLIHEALDWLRKNKTKKIVVLVGIGNEKVVQLAAKAGLFPKYIQLESTSA